MKVKLLVGRSGARVSQSAGEIVEVGEAEGKRMLDAGHAEAVTAKKETATSKATAEKAVKD